MKRLLSCSVLLLALSACATSVEQCPASRYVPLDLLKASPAVRQGDYQAAIRELSRRADDDPNARYLLGVMYEEGIGGKPDPARAALAYRAAGGRHHAKAQYHLAYLVWEGINRSSTNTERYQAREIFSYAAPQIHRLAEAGDAEAQTMLGYMYGTGKAYAVDRAASTMWYRRAAEQGHAKAQYELGRRLQGGFSDPSGAKDLSEALKWFRRSADNGYPEAQFHLGEAYNWGVLGVTPDRVEAMAWYGRAAAQGHARAAFAREQLGERLTPEEIGVAQGSADTVGTRSRSCR